MFLKHACTKVGNMFENTNARIYAGLSVVVVPAGLSAVPTFHHIRQRPGGRGQHIWKIRGRQVQNTPARESNTSVFSAGLSAHLLLKCEMHPGRQVWGRRVFCFLSPIRTLGDDRFGKFGYEPRGIIYKSTALKQLSTFNFQVSTSLSKRSSSSVATSATLY